MIWTVTLHLDADSADIAPLLLEHGANVDLPCWKGYTSLIAALDRNDTEKCYCLPLTLLYTQAAGETPIFYAKTEEAVNMLHAHGADLNHINDKGETVLINALKYHSTAVFSSLIALGSDPSIPIQTKRTLKQGRKPSYVTYSEQSVVSLAVSMGDVAALTALFSAQKAFHLDYNVLEEIRQADSTSLIADIMAPKVALIDQAFQSCIDGDLAVLQSCLDAGVSPSQIVRSVSNHLHFCAPKF